MMRTKRVEWRRRISGLKFDPATREWLENQLAVPSTAPTSATESPCEQMPLFDALPRGSRQAHRAALVADYRIRLGEATMQRQGGQPA